MDFIELLKVHIMQLHILETLMNGDVSIVPIALHCLQFQWQEYIYYLESKIRCQRNLIITALARLLLWVPKQKVSQLVRKPVSSGLYTVSFVSNDREELASSRFVACLSVFQILFRTYLQPYVFFRVQLGFRINQIKNIISNNFK